jgi:hypothetical protein
MGSGFLKNKRGQISIEFILIILIALIYIHSVVQPTATIASQSTEDVTRLSQAKLAAQKLAAGINQLGANQSDGRKTISLFVPKNSSIECASDRINFSAAMSDLREPPQCVGCERGCEGKECKGYAELIDGASPNCDFGGSALISAGNSNVFREVVIAKEAGVISVEYAS